MFSKAVVDFSLLFIPLYNYFHVNDSKPKRGLETYAMESKYFYQSGMCLKILKTTELRKHCNQARLSFKRSSGLSNAYMDTTSGLDVLKEQKDRINKKTTFPTIKTIH